MRDPGDVFHLAIPAYDLDETVAFYVGQLGCKLARRYDDRVTLDFFGDQVVCHLAEPPRDAPDTPRAEPRLYPRHFGVTFRRPEDFDALVRLVEIRKLPVFRPVELRFEGLVEEHRSLVLRDPADNLLEFKHYVDPRMMY
ncbi:VOC family protein [Frankia sp. AgB1.9]|uniref:VOC family protein n=1 Tax=unclassified Frankia TaxID=2632575 RepID=UPI0019313BC2|nr:MULTISPECIES: VOC family protein [unclassified Frankia]MBL7489840.1 VOC family protein [Frankia sp. AgW1.1]MBL7552700.1 VOC family protein [Frankia sp. AgB1.9]MBL7623865.1 VOC family protein [Frankia sp. AgB1.8]